jgi:hypothetical protein
LFLACRSAFSSYLPSQLDSAGGRKPLHVRNGDRYKLYFKLTEAFFFFIIGLDNTNLIGKVMIIETVNLLHLVLMKVALSYFTGFDPSILQHIGILGAADEAVE